MLCKYDVLFKQNKGTPREKIIIKNIVRINTHGYVGWFFRSANLLVTAMLLVTSHFVH